MNNESRMVRVGEVMLFVRELGEKRSDRTSLLVLHGGPDIGHSYLLPGVEPLARDHHVVLFDFRGCGRSSRGLTDDALQPEYVIEDAHELIGQFGLGPVDVLGFSTGGRAAIELVSRFPRDVRRLILASTSAYPASDADPYLRDWNEPQRRQAMEDAAGGALRNSTLVVWNLDLAPAYAALIENLDNGDWSYERWLTGAMHPWVNGDPEQILVKFGGRVLILHGAKDMGFPVQLAERLHRKLPDSEIAIIDEAAHMCHFEKPETWADRIRSFVGRV